MCQSGPVSSSESGNSTITRGRSWLDALGPGILVAATGVGAGDLAGGALAGARLKLAVLWVCLIGAALKFVLCEGLARWQLSTGTSVADGVFKNTPPVVRFTFLIFVLLGSSRISKYIHLEGYWVSSFGRIVGEFIWKDIG